MYQPRTYRRWVNSQDLVAFNVTVRETDLHITAATNLGRKARRLVLKYREPLERYIEHNPLFLTTLKPIPVEDSAPRIVRLMAESGKRAGVGPMAAVAGAIAELVGTDLLEFSPEVIIENGGDIFLRSLKQRRVAIYAGDSPLTGRIGLQLDPRETPLGISTSSGTVGHSLSFGKADAAVVVCQSAALSDAVATAVANVIQSEDDIPRGIDLARSIEGVLGTVIIKGERMGVWGDIKLCQTDIPSGSALS